MENANAILRCYVDDGKTHNQYNREDYYDNNTVFCFDVESSVDEYQNLLIGYYGVWNNDVLIEKGLFHGDLKPNEYAILKSYAIEHKIPLMNRDEFSDKLITWGFYRRALICGFNIGFDLCRVCLSWGTSKKHDREAFSLKISNDKYKPRIFLKSLDSKRSFINFVSPYSKNRKTRNNYSGSFCDLRTLTWVLTNASHSLESACRHFGVPLKSKIETYGVVNSKLISYNINDVNISYLLFKALLGKINDYDIPLYPHKLSSTASLLKAYCTSMGIHSFLDQNKEFSRSMLGFVLSSFYGAKVAVHVRKQTVNATYIDYLSMYPSQLISQQLWSYIIADHIDVKEDDKFQNFVDDIKLEDLTNKNVWSNLQGIGLVELNEDYFPIRSRFGGKITHNIGMAYLSGKQLWYTYADIIASKIKTGKAPKIIKAYRFLPVGLQPTLKPTKLFGLCVDPRTTDFIKLLIEHRLEVKEKLKLDPNNEQLRTEQHVCKIMANSLYGVGIETSTKLESAEVTVYGLESFKAKVKKTEHYGKMFNPLVSTLLTSGARLVLTMTEVFVERNSWSYFYEDCDAIFISPSAVKPVQAFFKPLNPYNKDVEMFKVERGNNGELLDNVLFLGISSKRYCLYKQENGKITIFKHSSHGLGGIKSMPEGWEEKFWMDIIKYNSGLVKDNYIEFNYNNFIVAGQLAITSPFLMKRFNRINKAKDLKHQIKPRNFITLGVSYRLDSITREPIIPMLPFTKDYSTVKYQPFIDYKNGKLYNKHTEAYWKPTDELFFEYVNHEEKKQQGGIGILSPRHINISNINYCGKESNNLEEAEVVGVKSDDYVYYDKNLEQKLMKRIETLTKEEAKQLGMKRWQYSYIKRCLKDGKVPKFKRKTLKLLGLL